MTAEQREQSFHSCACFYTDNIFLEDYQMHIRFHDEQQFRRDYERVLRRRGCRSEDHLKKILCEIEKEILRRKRLVQQSLERRTAISLSYKPLHPDVYVLEHAFLEPSFLEIVKYCTSPDADLDGLLSRLQSISDKRIYRFPMFVEDFCRRFVEEMEHFEKSELPKGRPNTMNNYGVLLNELGFDEKFITPLREKYIQPMTSILYPDFGGDHLDSHKAFVVKYALSEDLDLCTHYDNAEITLNVPLGKEFTEGNLYFADMRQLAVRGHQGFCLGKLFAAIFCVWILTEEVEVPANQRRYVEIEHVVGQGLLHRGEHIHGALPITSGERWNLIVWMRSALVRNQLCPMCDKMPQLVETLGFGDGFTQSHTVLAPETVDVCALF